jgi:exosome complex protein LRP1
MDQPNLLPLVEDLEAEIDDLEDAVQPLLKTSLPQIASSLPLLDKAKFYVLLAYSIESILYSTLQANGINAKEHPVFAELARLKTYFAKIKSAELGPEPKTRIDKDAAARFIKHGLAGNEQYDRERAERIAKEKAKAAFKAKQLKDRQHIKFDQKEEDAKMALIPKKRAVEEEQPESEASEGSKDVDSENEEMYGSSPHIASGPAATPASKKQRLAASGPESARTREDGTPKTKAELRAEKKALKNLEKELKQATGGTPEGTPKKKNKKRKGRGK